MTVTTDTPDISESETAVGGTLAEAGTAQLRQP